TIVVQASYPGAPPEVIADTVATPIEQAVNGVEDMLYMSSQSTTDGQITLTITFRLGIDLDKAQVLVQNRVAIAEPRPPDDVRRATAPAPRARVPVARDDARPAARARGVREHRRQDGNGRAHHARPRRRAHRAGGTRLFRQQLPR